ncbi:MAG TPA: DUF5719 family protein [Actinomycetes bacterium]|nr:DUF5719 family protein [Actinomycetes bacterium]
MRRGRNLALAAALLGAAVVVTGLASRLPSGTGATPARAGTPYSSRWLCPVLAGKGTLTVVNAGDQPATVRAALSTTAAGAGGPPTVKALPAGAPLAPGAARAIALSPTLPSLLEVESFGSPVAVRPSAQPSCASGPSTRLWLPALDPPDRGTADIVLANPGRDGAVVQLILHHADDPYFPGKLRRLLVPGRGAIRVPMAEYRGLIMSVQAVALLGRVVAGAVRTQPGRQPLLIAAQTDVRGAWSFAGAQAGAGDQTQAVLTNPGGDPLAVDVRVVSAKQAFIPPGFEDLEIPPGATKRVQLNAKTPGEGALGVEIRSRTGSPFTAALLVQTGRGGQYLDIGTDRPWQTWVLPTLAKGQQVVLANLGNSPVAAKIEGLGRAATGEPAMPVQVPPGRVVVKAPPPAVAAAGGLLVRADHTGIVAAPVGLGQALPGQVLAGLSLPGPVTAGPAAG